MTPEAFEIMWEKYQDRGWANWTEKNVQVLVESIQSLKPPANFRAKYSVLGFLGPWGDPHGIRQRLSKKRKS